MKEPGSDRSGTAGVVGTPCRLKLRPYLKTTLFILLAILILQTFSLTAFGPGGVNNIHVYQALGLLNGHVHLPFSDRGLHFDVALVDGRYQCPFPPLPALLLIPFVAVFGESTRVVSISFALTALNVFVLMQILRKLDVSSQVAPWIAAAFFLGSPYWGVLRGSAIGSYFSHIVAVTALLLALNEAFGKGRAGLVGLLLGAAFLSRQLSVYTGIFLATVLWQHERHAVPAHRLRMLAAFGVTFGMAVSVYFVFNWLRFGHPLDTGYSKWFLDTDPFMAERWARFGSFHPVYLFHNFAYMFLQGFHLEFSLPMYLDRPHLDPFGTSLTFASPFVFFAFKARWKKPLLWAAALTVGLCLCHALLYFGNGWVQENGQRYSLDFFPVLMLLVVQGIKNVEPRIWQAAIGYSVGLNLLAFSLIAYMYDLFEFALRIGDRTLRLLSRM